MNPVDSAPTVSSSLATQRVAVRILGLDGRGCAGLSSHAIEIAMRAQVLVGGERHLAFFPQHAGTQIVLGKKISETLDEVASLAEESDVCILASGDPSFFGVANLVQRKIGRDHVEVIPAVSAMQLAFARAQLPWSSAKLVSLHGRPMHGVVSRLRHTRTAGFFTDARNSPSAIARHLLRFGDAGWRATVCESLSMPEERVSRFANLEELRDAVNISDLNVLILERTDDEWCSPPAMGFLDEDCFSKKMPRAGLITKREVRALTLAQMRVPPSGIVWDVGAGSGSVSVEAARLAPEGSVFAIEVDEECIGYCRENVVAHGADNVEVIGGLAPKALEDLPRPDSVFIGGTKGSMAAIVDLAARKMNNGGSLVVNAITLESVSAVREAFALVGLVPNVTLLQVSRGAKLAHYLRYEALNPIHIFSATVERPSTRCGDQA